MDRISKLGFVAMVLVAVGFVLSQSLGYSQGQQNTATNKTTETTTNKNSDDPPKGFGGLKAPRPTQVTKPDASKATWDLPKDADKTANPVEASAESIEKGRELYFGRAGNCVFCHGQTGAGNEENLPRLQRKPANLSDSERMPKLSDGEIFWKITLGIPGIMPGRGEQLTEEQRWHLVNFVRTLAQEKSASP